MREKGLNPKMFLSHAVNDNKNEAPWTAGRFLIWTMEEVSIKIKQQQMGMDHKTGSLLKHDEKLVGI